MTEAAKKFIKLSIGLAFFFLIIRCLFGWNELTELKDAGNYFKLAYTFSGFAGEAITVTTILMGVFNKWLWKFKPFCFVADMPVLAKKYKGTITFYWEDKEQTKNTEIGIKQTFLNVNVKLGTDESSSNAVTASIQEEYGSKILIYTYLNTPRAEIQNRSAIHFGTAMLYVDDPKHLTGNYFTIRQSRGSMDLYAVAEKGENKSASSTGTREDAKQDTEQ